MERVEALQPDVVITDIRMPHMDGIAATHQLQDRFPKVGVIALSMFDEEQLILEMLEAGAKGYLLKNATKEEIIDAIEAVHAGEIYFCRSTSPKLAQLIGDSRINPFRKKPATELNEREKEIVRLLCEEFSSKEIAARVHLTVRTVETYRMSLLEKVGARNVAGLVIYAIKHGLYKL
jgi:DNA-binding NarL/FixJ family response regulator